MEFRPGEPNNAPEILRNTQTVNDIRPDVLYRPDVSGIRRILIIQNERPSWIVLTGPDLLPGVQGLQDTRDGVQFFVGSIASASESTCACRLAEFRRMWGTTPSIEPGDVLSDPL